MTPHLDRTGRAAPRRRAAFAALVALTGTGFAAAVSPSAALSQPVAGEVLEPILVTTQTVRLQQAADVAERFAGVVTARRESSLGFENGGLIDAIAVDLGDRVDAGQELARLDLRFLDAQIAAAEAGLRQADANAELARLTVQRQRELTARGNASAQARDEAEANDSATRAAVQVARAELEQLKVRRDLSLLVAPFAGVVTARHLDEGAVAGPGAPVLDLTETEGVEIRVGLPAAQSRTLRVGADYAFDIADRTITGRLRAVTQVVDRTTRTVATVFDVTDGEAAPGEVARLRLVGEAPGEGFWAPLTALSEGRRGLWTVFVAMPSETEPGLHTLDRRYVEIVHIEAERAYVRGAARDGERFVTVGLERVAPGQVVRLEPEDAAAPATTQVAGREPV